MFDLVIGVQAEPGELENREPARESGGITYRIWTEVEHFGAPPGPRPEAHLYTVDRAEGVIMFAPAAQIADAATGGLTAQPVALAEVPGPGRRIVAWYRHGGGANGNVAAGTLTTLKDAVPGRDRRRTPLRRPVAATARRLENAMVRGPQSIHTLRPGRDGARLRAVRGGGERRRLARARRDARRRLGRRDAGRGAGLRRPRATAATSSRAMRSPRR